MKYFIISDDININNLIKFIDFETRKRVNFLKKDIDRLNDITTLYVAGDKDSIYPDFIEAPVTLVSNKLKKIFDIYEDTIIYKTTVLTNLDEGTQEVYRLMITDVLDCISDKTTYHKNGVEKEIVLEKKSISEFNVFQVKGKEKYYLVVSLDVIESILRRDLMGVKFKEVKVV